MFLYQSADYSSLKEHRVKTQAGAESADKQAETFTFVWRLHTKRWKGQKKDAKRRRAVTKTENSPKPFWKNLDDEEDFLLTSEPESSQGSFTGALAYF